MKRFSCDRCREQLRKAAVISTISPQLQLRPFYGQRSAYRFSFSTSAASSSKRSAIYGLLAPRALFRAAGPHVMDALLRSGEQSVVSGPQDPT
ncbi:hypothetical protein NDU88_005651 [Pleurodeles waltl]|uniref:Uncharacterized protein n=1 Tax=Pleurodeles waltl TaxID=8319 RepID=A0AAV7WDB3_PLEWA|nr:hypothetical protein NDU88_005651 [Pleurodeles waltl]